MKKANDKGSSILLLVMALFLVGAVAGAGYYVYNKNKNSKSTTSGNVAAPDDTETKMTKKVIWQLLLRLKKQAII